MINSRRVNGTIGSLTLIGYTVQQTIAAPLNAKPANQSPSAAPSVETIEHLILKFVH